MFSGEIEDDVDPVGIRSIDSSVRVVNSKEEAHDFKEESQQWNVEPSDLQLSLNEMSRRLRAELALEKTSPRGHSSTRGSTMKDGKGSLEDGNEEQEAMFPTLIPGLPMDLAQICLSRVPWICQPQLMSVCKTWAAYMMSDNIFSVRAQQGLTESFLLVLSVPVRLGPLRLSVFDAKAATRTEWRKPLAVFDYLGRWSGFLRGFRCAVVGPDLFIMGGRHDGLQYATGRNVWRFNFVTRKWTEAAPMHAARRDFACATVGEKIYVAGGTVSHHVVPHGHGDKSALKSAEVYDYAHDCWDKLEDMETERVGCMGVAVEDRFFAIGGGTDNGTVEFELFRSAEVLDTSEEPLRWKTIDDMWQSHVMLPRAVAGFDHSLFAVDSNDQTLKSYDEVTNEWSDVMPMPTGVTSLPGSSGRAERQQAMGGLPGDQLVDFPREGLFWMEPCKRPSQVNDYHLLRLHESEHESRSSGRNWSGNVVGDNYDDDAARESASSSAAARPTLQSKFSFRSLGMNSYLIIGSEHGDRIPIKATELHSKRSISCFENLAQSYNFLMPILLVTLAPILAVGLPALPSQEVREAESTSSSQHSASFG